MFKSISIVLVLCFAVTADATCKNYECRRTMDTAACWERYGPQSPRFSLGTTCEGRSQCIWTHTVDQGWMEVCHHDCEITQCYEI